jgi:hypothetical protein
MREGLRTERFVLRPIELDRRIDTLVSAQPPPAATNPSPRTAADMAALAAWVRAGGKLVYLGRSAALGDAETKVLELPFWLPDVGARGRLEGRRTVAVNALAALGPNRMLLVEHAGSAELSDTNGDIEVRYPLGNGEVVAVTDPAPFTNANIARADNARLAYLLALPRRPGGVVAFDDGLHGALVDRPWYRALPVPVRVSLAFAGVALVLGLIGSALPGAPAMRLEPVREPTSGEFVAALAALYERTGARSAARSILVRAALAGAGPSDDRPSSMSEYAPRPLAARRRLAGALDRPVSSDADLLAIAKLAYNVRKDCSHGGNGDGRRAAFAGRSRTGRRW